MIGTGEIFEIRYKFGNSGYIIIQYAIMAYTQKYRF